MSIAAWRKLDAALKSFEREGRAGAAVVARRRRRDGHAGARDAWRSGRSDTDSALARRHSRPAPRRTCATILARGESWAALVHGFAHKNYAPPGRESAPSSAIIAPSPAHDGRVAHGARPARTPPARPCPRRAGAALEPDRARSFCRCSDRSVSTALSTFGPRPRRTPIPTLNSHVDIMNWRSPPFRRRRCRAGQVHHASGAQRRAANDPGEPIGLLTHHRQHDRAAEQFLDRLVRHVAKSEGARWLSLDEVLAEVTISGEVRSQRLVSRAPSGNDNCLITLASSASPIRVVT